jgi:hypothetical protein
MLIASQQYLFVFSVSLVRLVYDMVNDEPSPLLGLLSAWMVLSVGLMDGLVYVSSVTTTHHETKLMWYVYPGLGRIHGEKKSQTEDAGSNVKDFIYLGVLAIII